MNTAVWNKVVTLLCVGMIACSDSSGSGRESQPAADADVAADASDGVSDATGLSDTDSPDGQGGDTRSDGGGLTDASDTPEPDADTSLTDGGDDAEGDAGADAFDLDSFDFDTLDVDAGPLPADGVSELIGPDGIPAIAVLPELDDRLFTPAEVADDGVLVGLVEVVLDPEASLGTLRNVLATNDALLVASQRSMPYLVLRVSATSSAETVEAATALAATPGVLFAFASRVPEVSDNKRLPAEGYELRPELIEGRWPAAWNARSLALLAAEPPRVVVADVFLGGDRPDQLQPLAPLGLQPGCSRRVEVGSSGFFTDDGNHGFWVSSILAAPFDDAPPTGVVPVNLPMFPVQMGCTGATVGMTRVASEAGGSSRVVVNASLGYADPTFASVSRTERALHALQWRVRHAGFANRAVMVVAAGNDGAAAREPDLAYFMITAARVGDLRTLVPPADAERFGRLWNFETARNPAVASTLGHTLVVGGSELDGTEWSGSVRGGDVRAVSVNVEGACSPAAADVRCDENGLLINDGTSAAAPQVAGLLSYLWLLEPELSPAEARTTVIASFREGLVDAYAAVLALESGPHRTPIRRAILDVDGDGEVSAADIQTFDTAYDFVDPELPDYPAHDLTGDGFASRRARGPFDTDLDGEIEPFAGMGTVDEEDTDDHTVFCAWTSDPALDLDASLTESLLNVCECRAGDSIEHPILGVLMCVPAGIYFQGCDLERDGIEVPETPLREVSITSSLWVMEQELTAQQAELIAPDPVWSSTACDAEECAVSGVDLLLAIDVMEALSAADGRRWRLPSEAEWEYAARGGEDFAYAGSDVAEEVGWTRLNTDNTQGACLLPRNGYGLCDMTGNVPELTLDAASVFFNGVTDALRGWTIDPVTNPQRVPTVSDQFMIIRGGGVFGSPDFTRTCARQATVLVNRLGSNSIATMRLVRRFEVADLLPPP